MNSKNLIHRVLEFDHPPRIGLDFNPPHASDLVVRPVTRFAQSPLSAWGRHAGLARMLLLSVALHVALAMIVRPRPFPPVSTAVVLDATAAAITGDVMRWPQI